MSHISKREEKHGGKRRHDEAIKRIKEKIKAAKNE
jgi:hypothetical protein